MHGLINRSLQCFLRDTYGLSAWVSIAEEAGVDPVGFEAMLSYDDAVTEAVLHSAAHRLSKPRGALLEDWGMFLVSLGPLRRLLRFGGVNYVDFLHSLDELPERARLAVPDLNMPELVLHARGEALFTLVCHADVAGFAAVFAGILRAMADDYGALALIDLGKGEEVQIELLQTSFASGRDFSLARPELG